MRFVETFQAGPFADTVVSLLAAFVLGTLIGAERQYRQRAPPACAPTCWWPSARLCLVDLGMHRRQRRGGAGDLLRGLRRRLPWRRRDHEGRHERARPEHRRHPVVSAAVGSCTGADMLAEGVLLTVLIIAGNTLLRPLVKIRSTAFRSMKCHRGDLRKCA